jgi:hypothetical protein
MKTQTKWLIVVGLGLLGWFTTASADGSGNISPPKRIIPTPPQSVVSINHLP